MKIWSRIPVGEMQPRKHRAEAESRLPQAGRLKTWKFFETRLNPFWVTGSEFDGR